MSTSSNPAGRRDAGFAGCATTICECTMHGGERFEGETVLIPGKLHQRLPHGSAALPSAASACGPGLV
jgi:hypothetical protein